MYYPWYIRNKILGIHKNHEVQTVKKAYPVVKQIVGEIHEANTEF